MYKNIILGIIAASVLTIALSVLCMAVSVSSMKAEISGIRDDIKSKDPMQVIAKWEEMKKTAQKEQSELKPGTTKTGFRPMYTGKNPELREPGSFEN